MVQTRTPPRNLAHATCQSWRGARLWRLTLKKNRSVAHAKQKFAHAIREFVHAISGVRGGMRKMRHARFCLPVVVRSRGNNEGCGDAVLRYIV